MKTHIFINKIALISVFLFLSCIFFVRQVSAAVAGPDPFRLLGSVYDAKSEQVLDNTNITVTLLNPNGFSDDDCYYVNFCQRIDSNCSCVLGGHEAHWTYYNQSDSYFIPLLVTSFFKWIEDQERYQIGDASYSITASADGYAPSAPIFINYNNAQPCDGNEWCDKKSINNIYLVPDNINNYTHTKIKGQITDSQTNQPISNALVKLIITDNNSVGAENYCHVLHSIYTTNELYCVPNEPMYYQTHTDQNGRYDFTQILSKNGSSFDTDNFFAINVSADNYNVAEIPYLYSSSVSCSPNENCNKKVVNNFQMVKENNNQRVPVIIVPGILGSELKKGDEVMWPNAWGMIGSNDQFMDGLLQDANGDSLYDGVYANDVVRKAGVGIVQMDYLGSLITSLKSQGYTEGTDLFVFPYDWRLDINKHSQDLDNKINEVLNITQTDKVDIVAHSAGGLVVKNMIVQDRTMENKINKLIFVGVPHLGSPSVYKNIVFGSDLDVKFAGISFLNTAEIKKLAKNMMLLYQLLPTQKYFDILGPYVSAYNPLNINMPYNTDFNYTQTKWNLISNGANPSLLQKAEQLHTAELDNFSVSPESSIKIYNITGCELPTLIKLGERSKNYFNADFNSTPKTNAPEYYAYFASGDNTVPAQSSAYLNSPHTTKFYIKNAAHASMLSENIKSRDFIVHLLRNSNPLSSLPSGISTFFNNYFLLYGTMLSVHSPVAVNVYDQNNNHIGYTTYTTTTDNGQTVSYQILDQNIPGASYEQIGDNKFVFLPSVDDENNNNTYRVELDPYATGTFSLRVTSINADQPVQSSYFRDIPISNPDLNTGVLTIANPDQPNNSFEYKQEQTIFDPDTNSNITVFATSTVTATAVLDANQTEDITPPSTTLQITEGSLNQDNWSSSSIKIKLSADDNLSSNILKTEYRILTEDNTNTPWLDYTQDQTINVGKEGKNTVEYYSIDKTGNVESAKSQEINIDLTVPEVSLYFEPQNEKMVFTGIDSTATTVLSSDTEATITDISGHILKFAIQKTKNNNLITYHLKNFTYDEIIKNKNQELVLTYIIQKNKTGKLILSTQTAKLNTQILISALYNSQTNKTLIAGINDRKIVLKNMPGLVNLMFNTKLGVIKLTY